MPSFGRPSTDSGFSAIPLAERNACTALPSATSGMRPTIPASGDFLRETKNSSSTPVSTSLTTTPPFAANAFSAATSESERTVAPERNRTFTPSSLPSVRGVTIFTA